MKTKTIPLLLAACLLTLTGCSSDNTTIAPAGPKAAALSLAVGDSVTASQGASSANAAALSKVSASAGAIRTINASGPETPARQGIDGEASLIQTVAGQPTEADQLAAAERARIVAEGNVAKITAQYQAALAKADATARQLADANARAAAAQAALAKADADAKAEQAAAAIKFQRALDDARAAAKAEQRRLLTWIFFGGAALLTTIGIALIVFAEEVPIFGRKAGKSVLLAAVALAALGTCINIVQDFADAHPYWVGAGIIIALLSLAGAVGLMVANHYHLVSLPASASAKVEAGVQEARQAATGLWSRLVGWVKGLFGKKAAATT